MTLDLTQTRIDYTRPQFRAMLDKLQCNILKPHGREHAGHLFIQFIGDPAPVKAWIRQFTADSHHLTSAWDQLEQIRIRKEQGIDGGMVGGFFLSAEGYRYLGFDPEMFDDEHETFRHGMKHHDVDLVEGILDTTNKDPLPATWEANYQETVHALILLADDSLDKVQAEADQINAALSGLATVLAVEYGHVLRNAQPEAAGTDESRSLGAPNSQMEMARSLQAPGGDRAVAVAMAPPAPPKGQHIEHFGYVDGRSLPVFLVEDVDKETGGTDLWDPAAPLSLALTPDPLADENEVDSFGSYFVFRKLEQNVSGFNAGVRALAETLGIAPELAGAFIVGRFKDGTPVTLQQTNGLQDVNNFDYKETDMQGNRCPFHAHIRKANPRGEAPILSPEDERTRRVVRRGIPYGDRNLADPPSGGVGLLFMCYQSNIHHQFEFLQRTWIDNPNFPHSIIPLPFLPHAGDDPLIGQDIDNNASQNWPTGWDATSRIRANFGDYVTLKGGEYFFAPSISFLRSL